MYTKQMYTKHLTNVYYCDGIFEKSMFYTALSRVIDPKNMKVLNFKESYIKCNKSALEFEIEGSYISYFEKMLIENDEDKLKVLRKTY